MCSEPTRRRGGGRLTAFGSTSCVGGDGTWAAWASLATYFTDHHLFSARKITKTNFPEHIYTKIFFTEIPECQRGVPGPGH